MTPRSSRAAWAAVTVILVGVIALVVYSLTRTTTPPDVSRPPVTSSAVLADLSSVPASAYDAVGAGSPGTPLTPPSVLHGQPLLQSAGKPEVLFVGAEFCPFCAAERWPLVLALSRFGRFEVLHNVQSAPTSAFPAIQSFSFFRVAYTSRYVSFTGVELYSDSTDAEGAYAKIASLTPGQAALVSRYGAHPASAGTPAIPFVDVANRLVTSTSGYSPSVIVGASQIAVLSALEQPAKPLARGAPRICQRAHGRHLRHDRPATRTRLHEPRRPRRRFGTRAPLRASDLRRRAAATP